MLKYIKLLGMWKDVKKVYEEEKGTKKPWYVSRRFYGAVVILIGGALYAFLDVTLPVETLNTMADNVTTVSKSVKEIVPAIVSLYGAVTSIVGIIKRSKDAQ